MIISARLIRTGLLAMFASLGIWNLSQAEDQPEKKSPAPTAEAPSAASPKSLAPADKSAPSGLADQAAMMRSAPKVFRSAVAKIKPAMVVIESFGGVDGKGMRGVGKPGEGPTTGLIVSNDGYIVTSTFNFIRKPPIITVVLADGTRHVAQLLGKDNTRKLCVLKIDGAKNLAVPKFAARDKVRIGQFAISVGVGIGDSEAYISTGIISALDRVSGRAVQTDANISPANYGGPLIDIEGQVLGICVPLSPMSKDVSGGVDWYDSGIGFAIPIDANSKFIETMKKGEYVQAAFLGARLALADEAAGTGAKIQELKSEGPAADAGLKVGDILISVDGKPVQGVAHMHVLMNDFAAGDTAVFKVNRDGKEQEIKVKFRAPPE